MSNYFWKKFEMKNACKYVNTLDKLFQADLFSAK
jgi:hypothetical protein